MKDQPEALRLADYMDDALNDPNDVADAVSAELRRLHAENESLRQIVHDFPPVEAELREVSDRAHRLEAQRDALLEALKDVVAFTGAHGGPYAQARAAIKAVEEGK